MREVPFSALYAGFSPNVNWRQDSNPQSCIHCNRVMSLTRKPLLKGKAQYHWPPSF